MDKLLGAAGNLILAKVDFFDNAEDITLASLRNQSKMLFGWTGKTQSNLTFPSQLSKHVDLCGGVFADNWKGNCGRLISQRLLLSSITICITF